jgi:hypothetical protein
LFAEESGDDSDLRLAAELRRDAEMAFNSLRWYPRFENQVSAPVFGPEYSWRAERAAEWIDRYRRGHRLRKQLDTIVVRVSSDDYKEFELGLEALGSCLGFESVRPNQEADPDCAWREGNTAWILWEAKTMEHAEKPLAARDIRQANTHHIWVSNQLGWPDPEHSITAVVCWRREVDPAAATVCNADLFLVSPDVVHDIANRANEALTTAAAEAPGLAPDAIPERIARIFSQYRLGTTELLEELTHEQINKT